MQKSVHGTQSVPACVVATEHRRSQSEHLKAVGTAVQCALSDLHAFPYNAPIVGSALSLCIYAARFCKLIGMRDVPVALRLRHRLCFRAPYYHVTAGHSQLLMAHQPKLKAACDTAKQLHTSDTRVLVAASTLSSLLM